MKHSLKFSLTASLAAAMLLGACQSGPTATSVGSDAISGRVVEEYRLGSGDQVRVTVFGEDELSGEFFVDNTGLAMPLIGKVGAIGMTTQEFERALQERLADGYLVDPRVAAEVLNFRPFYILGEVGAPGEYPYTSGLTITNAVATAQGFTYRANKSIALVKGADGDQTYRVELTPNTLVAPGDTITILERFF